MEKFYIVAMLLAGILCVGGQDSGQMDDINARLSALEAAQSSMEQSLHAAQQSYAEDMQQLAAQAQELKGQVEENQELLEEIQEAMENQEPEEVPLSGACLEGQYSVINDSRRSPAEEYNGYDDICDRNIDAGWYRFYQGAHNAFIPTSCVPTDHCYTDAPLWVDLRGRPLPLAGQEVEVRACAHWSSDCCNWSYDITVRNCGEFFVYKLTPPTVCSLAYCAEAQV